MSPIDSRQFHLRIGRRGRRTSGLILALALALGGAGSATAADSGAVPGSVTVEQAVACLLVEGSFDFGTQAFSEPSPSTPGHRSSTQAALSNCGTGVQDVFVRGTDAVGSAIPPAAWGLSAQANGPCAIDVYGVTVQRTDVANLPRIATSLLDASFETVGAGGAVEVSADLYMPCSGSSGSGETMTFSTIFTAVLSDSVTVVNELEPNDDLATAQDLALGGGVVTAAGAITPIGDVDAYQVTLPQGPVTIETFDASGAASCVGIDTFVRVVNSSNSIVGQDDDNGIGTCSLVVLDIPATAGYYVLVSEWADDATIAGYRLRITTQP